MDLKQKEKYFELYSNCIPVKGYKRSIIYDLQNRSWDFIPNTLYEILQLFQGKKISQCYDDIPKDQHQILDEYFNFLIQKDYLNLSDTKVELNCFPALQTDFDSPNIISNAILDFDTHTLNDTNFSDYLKVINEIADLGCAYMQIRFFGKERICDLLIKLLSTTQYLDYEIELFCPYSKEDDISFYEQLFQTIKNLNFLLVYDVPNYSVEHLSKTKYPIHFTNQVFHGQECCGVIGPHYFTVNPFLFTESLNSNSCLNRKLGIDVDGGIKNCPSMSKTFFTVGERPVSDLVIKEEFKELWKIRKDEINVCKVCEFRHMCTDCRAFLPDKYDKPFKCTYDPFSAKWSDPKDVS